MIYLFDIDLNTAVDIIRDSKISQVCSKKDPNKLHPKETDTTIFYNYHFRKVLETLPGKTYPNKKMSKLCGDRIDQLTLLDNITKYPSEKEMFKKVSGTYFLKPDKIYKVGNDHQGNNKYTFPETKSIKIYHENLIIEEFAQGRSIRVLFIGNEMFFVEQVSEHKIKNIDPEEILIEPIKELEEDALNIKKFLDDNDYISPTIGLDYVYSESKTIFLELNDMCGVPEKLQPIFKKELQRIVDELSQKT